MSANFGNVIIKYNNGNFISSIITDNVNVKISIHNENINMTILLSEGKTTI